MRKGNVFIFLEENENNINYGREFVLYEDGSFYGGWNKDIKQIY